MTTSNFCFIFQDMGPVQCGAGLPDRIRWRLAYVASACQTLRRGCGAGHCQQWSQNVARVSHVTVRQPVPPCAAQLPSGLRARSSGINYSFDIHEPLSSD